MQLCHMSFPSGGFLVRGYKRQRILEKEGWWHQHDDGGLQQFVSKNAEETTKKNASSGFSILALDVLVHIMSFLPLDDQDNLSVTCRSGYEARIDPSLDQIRTATVVFKTGYSGNRANQSWDALSLLEIIYHRDMNRVLKGRRRRLKLVGLHGIQSAKMSQVAKLSKWVDLDKVHSLDISFDRCLEPSSRKVKNSVVKSLAMILPNLRELDLSYMRVTKTAVNTFARYCPNLTIFRWKGSQNGLRIGGENLAMCLRLKEIDVEDSKLYCSISRNEWMPSVYDPESAVVMDALQLFSSCCSSQLERVNIKGCLWHSSDIMMDSSCEQENPAKIPEESIIQFVQNTPTLKVLECDLSDASKERLQKEYSSLSFRD